MIQIHFQRSEFLLSLLSLLSYLLWNAHSTNVFIKMFTKNAFWINNRFRLVFMLFSPFYSHKHTHRTSKNQLNIFIGCVHSSLPLWKISTQCVNFYRSKRDSWMTFIQVYSRSCSKIALFSLSLPLSLKFECISCLIWRKMFNMSGDFNRKIQFTSYYFFSVFNMHCFGLRFHCAVAVAVVKRLLS